MLLSFVYHCFFFCFNKLHTLFIWDLFFFCLKGLFVSHVDERSSAKLNKVRFGDKIQCINDTEVTSYTQAKQLIEETHPTVNFSFIDW